MFGDPEYYAKPLNPFGSSWQLAKFEGSSEPLAVYLLHKREGKWQCGCPGFRDHKHCKHQQMIENFTKRRIIPKP